MTNDRNQRRKQPGAADALRREIGNRANRRLVRKLPAFEVSYELPDRLRSLLDRLDEAEGRAT